MFEQSSSHFLASLGSQLRCWPSAGGSTNRHRMHRRPEIAAEFADSPRFVFSGFINETGWSDGTAWMLGLLQSCFSLTAYDAYVQHSF